MRKIIEELNMQLELLETSITLISTHQRFTHYVGDLLSQRSDPRLTVSRNYKKKQSDPMRKIIKELVAVLENFVKIE